MRFSLPDNNKSKICSQESGENNRQQGNVRIFIFDF